MRQLFINAAARLGQLKGNLLRPLPRFFKVRTITALGFLAHIPGKFGSLAYVLSYNIVKFMCRGETKPLWVRRSFKDGFSMRLDVVGKTQRILYLHKTYEPHVSNFLRKNIRSGDTFIDIGANVGFYTLLAAQRVGTGGAVFSFEPQKDNFETLKENIKQNGFSNVAASEIAIGEKIGTVSFYINPLNEGGGGVTPIEYYSDDKEEWSREDVRKEFGNIPLQETVTMTTFDQFLKESNLRLEDIRLIKIDIEGGELGALRGAERMLEEKKAPDIICEVSSNQEEVWSILKRNGYEIFTLLQTGERGDKIFKKESFRGRDFLFTKHA